MDAKKPYLINLQEIAARSERLEIPLDDSFFEGLDQQEIMGGKLIANVEVRLTGSGVYELKLSEKGSVRVACDRCLEPVELPIEGSDIRQVVSYEAAGTSEELPSVARDGSYDIAWDLYEIAVLALPLRRTHEEGECSPEMQDLLNQYGTQSDSETN